MFIVERSGFRLTKNFYIIAVIMLLAMTGSLGAIFTMHVHLGPSREPDKPSKKT
jgi:hypothetical protein